MIRFSTTLLATLIATSMSTATVDLRIMETTDLYNNMMDSDYYKDTATERSGPIRTASLINDTRNEVKNSVLVDNDDLVQGSPLVDYMSARGLKASGIHPVYKALNTLDYTIGTFSNHEFSYDLDYLKNALAGAKFLHANANVINAGTEQPMFTPYLIKDTEAVNKDGKEQTLRIDCTGVVPPQIMGWDKTNLSGKMTVNDITEVVHRYVSEMRERDADVVAVLAHSELSADPYKVMAEDLVHYLNGIPGTNAIMFGHARVIFPGKDFAGIEGTGIAKGTLNGVPAVMSGMQDDHLGVADLQLNDDSSKWRMAQTRTEARPIYDIADKKSLAVEDSKLVETLKADHDATRQFVSKPTSKSADNMHNYLVLVQDDPAAQVVNNAQGAYAEHYIQSDPDLAKLSVLSAAIPSKVGGHKNDPASYVGVEESQLTFRNAADLYLYLNMPIVMKVSGKKVKKQLECSVGQFNQIDPNNTKPQSFANWDGSRIYNFDVIDGVDYQVDVTQSARYDDGYQMINANTGRIKNPTFNGKPIDPNAMFLVVTGSYRVCGDKFAGTGDSRITFALPDENRLVLAAWITDESKRAGEIHPTADNNWCLTLIADDKKLGTHSKVSPSNRAAAFVKERGQYPMNEATTDDTGFAIYRVGLSK